ncbi:hypothetical protein KRP22_004906 [Phytophthora ramorum]|nr:hypothetical protein KRP22_12490 [Phytophthora ramorum]
MERCVTVPANGGFRIGEGGYSGRLRLSAALGRRKGNCLLREHPIAFHQAQQWNKKLSADRNKPNLAEVIKRDLESAKSVLKLEDPLSELRQFDVINEQRDAYADRLMASGVPPGSLASINRLYQELMTTYGVKGGSFPFLISLIIVDTNQGKMRSVLNRLAGEGVGVCKELHAHPHFLIAKLIILVRLRNLLAPQG